MTSKKQVRGLLDVVEAEAQGEEWELAEQTLGDALGLGLGATEQARRWALIGMEHEAKMQSRRPAHRPKTENITKMLSKLSNKRRALTQAKDFSLNVEIPMRL